MIVLDTNVLSELMRSAPHPSVFAWTAGQRRSDLYTTSVNVAEILYGIAAMPLGRRRSGLTTLAEAMFMEDFVGRILPFDDVAAAQYAEIVTSRRRQGRPIEAFDAQIAAIALVAKADLATRDMSGFAGCGLSLIDPWGTR
ncbi:MAG TPA: type II toxin-antitoxin system VapC family toxin [Stellaceae bacterium]|nr:type II toxin-antitoxin system VapC family toxin [Stellaceae bacterium]